MVQLSAQTWRNQQPSTYTVKICAGIKKYFVNQYLNINYVNSSVEQQSLFDIHFLLFSIDYELHQVNILSKNLHKEYVVNLGFHVPFWIYLLILLFGITWFRSALLNRTDEVVYKGVHLWRYRIADCKNISLLLIANF